MKQLLLLAIIGLFLSASSKADKPAYLLYTKDGEVISYSELMEQALQNDMIFFGELHNSAIAHWLQHEMARDLAEDTSRNTIIGMEMFEADQQILIDEYFSGLISQSSFESEARLWNNYHTDYKPVVEFAKSNGLKVVATNIPRRYASSVFREGLKALEALSSAARRWMAPLPIEVDKNLPAYQNMLQMAHGHGGDNLIYAQAVKDATMAHFIILNMGLNDRLLHLNGSYHSNDWEGIIWYINEMVSGYEILTINTITVDDPLHVDSEKLQSADVTLVVPSRMTTTY
ncbi:MAG: iron-regulated protein [Balneolaceae bacterium]|nr:MAG: iron-regulated protein [Balneolaceae bacterium]